MDGNNNKNYTINVFWLIILYSIISILIIFFVNFWPIRILTIPLFFFLLGYPLSFFISNLNSWERVFLSFGMSSLIMLLTYYFQYFTNFYLGITPTFHQFVIEMVVVLWIIIGILYFKRRDLCNSKQIEFKNSLTKVKNLVKENRFLLLIIIIAMVLRFTFLNYSDFATDDTIFSAVTYPVLQPDQVMGLPSPPIQFLAGHHPPIFHLQANININLLNPSGWIFMEDWMVKFQSAFIGILAVIFCYGIVKNIYDKRSAYISTLIFAVCTFAVVMSLVFYQEALFILLVGITFYFAYKERWGLTGFFVGISLLVKFSALVLIPAIMVYLAIRYLRFDMDQFKLLLKKFTSFALIVLILYLPIIITNIVSYIELGYMDTFWSRVLGLADPMTEAVGSVEIPIYGTGPGILNYFSFQMSGLVNIFGIVLFIFLVFCAVLSLFDKKEHLFFNLALISFVIIYLLIFTSRGFQIITLSPIIFPLIILSSHITKLLSNIDKKIKTRVLKYIYNSRKWIIYGTLVVVVGVSFFYSVTTVAFDHSDEIGTKDRDATHQVENPAYYYSNLGYLWISRYGYDDLMGVIRNYPTHTVFIDDDHPRFSYIYYFWVRNYTNLISDWNYENNSLFVIYKSPSYIWEAFQRTSADDSRQINIEGNYSPIFENYNFRVYVIN